jgi:predicted DNA-binding transcriptional regulator AlpA
MSPARDLFIQRPLALLNERETALLVGMSISTLRRWRREDKGPRFIRISAGAVRYSPVDVANWIASRPRGGAQQEREEAKA